MNERDDDTLPLCALDELDPSSGVRATPRRPSGLVSLGAIPTPQTESIVGSGVEVVLASSVVDGVAPFVEIYTENSVYSVSSELICVAVRKLSTGDRYAHHSLIGARLAGGRRVTWSRHCSTGPLPVPGTEALFEIGLGSGGWATTSRVERVVLHIQTFEVPLAREPEPERAVRREKE